MKKKYSVDCYCQDDPSGKSYRKNYDIIAQNESEAEDKADKKYKNEMGFAADTIEAHEIPVFNH